MEQGRTFAERLKEHYDAIPRGQKGGIAHRAGIGSAYLSELLNGKKVRPTLDVVQKLAAALGVPVSVLVDDLPETPDNLPNSQNSVQLHAADGAPTDASGKSPRTPQEEVLENRTFAPDASSGGVAVEQADPTVGAAEIDALKRRIAAGDTSDKTIMQFLMVSTLEREQRDTLEARTRLVREQNLARVLPHTGDGPGGEEPAARG